MGFGSCRHECDNTQPFSVALLQQQLQVGRRRTRPPRGEEGRAAGLQPTARGGGLQLCKHSNASRQVRVLGFLSF